MCKKSKVEFVLATITTLFLTFNVTNAKAEVLSSLPCGGTDYLPIIQQKEKQAALADIEQLTAIPVKTVISENFQVQSVEPHESHERKKLKITYQLQFSTPDESVMTYEIVTYRAKYRALDLHQNAGSGGFNLTPFVTDTFEYETLYWHEGGNHDDRVSSYCVFELNLASYDWEDADASDKRYGLFKGFTVKRSDGSVVVSKGRWYPIPHTMHGH